MKLRRYVSGARVWGSHHAASRSPRFATAWDLWLRLRARSRQKQTGTPETLRTKHTRFDTRYPSVPSSLQHCATELGKVVPSTRDHGPSASLVFAWIAPRRVAPAAIGSARWRTASARTTGIGSQPRAHLPRPMVPWHWRGAGPAHLWPRDNGAPVDSHRRRAAIRGRGTAPSKFVLNCCSGYCAARHGC
jgi:hypothetical protein